jgi:hypothetical protein
MDGVAYVAHRISHITVLNDGYFTTVLQPMVLVGQVWSLVTSKRDLTEPLAYVYMYVRMY